MSEQILNFTPQPVSPGVFRSVMGSFPTGVTVVTARDADGAPLGLTVNAITSVSLDPPQLLICLAKHRYTATAVRETGKFAVNFLGRDQQDVAALFASQAEAKFDTINARRGELDLPLIPGSLAQAECSVRSIVEAGDHLIFIGEVVAGTVSDGQPLMFYRRNYGAWCAI